MKRTTCAWCDRPLTKRQITQNRTYCSRGHAKEAYHAANPEAARRIGRTSWQPGGRNWTRYVQRLRTALAGCKTLGEAYRKGYRNGYTVGATHRRRARVASRAA